MVHGGATTPTTHGAICVLYANADEAAMRDHLGVALTLGVLRMLHPPLHYLLLLLLSFLTCAVRGDINLSDRLCDPPCGLGGRRGAVNINILPGFTADTEQPRPP